MYLLVAHVLNRLVNDGLFQMLTGRMTRILLMQAFAADLRRLFNEMESLDPEMMADVSRGTVTASAVVADESLNRILLQLVSVADTHGVRFPRVFGILIKQVSACTAA